MIARLNRGTAFRRVTDLYRAKLPEGIGIVRPISFRRMSLVQKPLTHPLKRCPLRRRSAQRLRATGNGVSVDEVEDRFVSRLLKNCFSADRGAYGDVQDRCLQVLSTLRMPTRREEGFRFTDISPIIKAEIKKTDTSAAVELDQISELTTGNDFVNSVVVLNGAVQWNISNLEPDLTAALLESNAPLNGLGTQSSARGGPFATLNGALFRDLLCFSIPKNVEIKQPLHILYLTSGGDGESGMGVSAPRLFIRCATGSSFEVIEEFATLSNSSHLTLPLCEIELEEDAELSHHYVQLEAASSFHVKTTLVQQHKHSKYRLVESSVGGELSRHELSIVQDGEETETEMDHFHLSGDAQLHDLHSQVTLDHKAGVVQQLHKCIVASAAGSGVFDGNVQVKRQAQKTDAGQLSRNLLLAPKATVNVKPNLQIIADDVKCTHGCTVSDLSDEEVFYFRARGIDLEAARRALVYSFGSEVNQKLISESLRKRVDDAVLNTLASL